MACCGEAIRIGLHTPADVHYGLAAAKKEHRSQALAAARSTNPVRFATSHDPEILNLSDKAWINQPEQEEDQAA